MSETASSADRVAVPTPGVAASRNRRRPLLIVVGIMLIATSALAAAFAFSQISTTTPVVGVVRDVPAGQLLERADLGVVEVNAGSGLETVAADRLEEMVGLRAVRDLGAGTTLTPQSVAEILVPGDGLAVIGVVAAPGTAPVQGLEPGAQVGLVELTVAGGTVGGDGGPVDAEADDPTLRATVTGRVIAIRELADGSSYQVDVEVAAEDADPLQRLAAEQRLGLVIVSKER